MSAQEPAAVPRERVISAGATPLPPVYRQISLALAVLGGIVFLIGAFTGNDRAWHAFQVNWLFWATVCRPSPRRASSPGTRATRGRCR
ncbi:MAG: hypothetical protein ACHQSE_09750, partial [Gemmatimonadales bacterium]